jgi:acylphosphatase
MASRGFDDYFRDTIIVFPSLKIRSVLYTLLRHAPCALPCEAQGGVTMENKARAHAVISGRVQGVFFRMETKRAADGLGVFGWVKNQPDGTVEAVFEGDRERVEAVLDWCREGPPPADVTAVKVEWEDYTGEFKGFDINFAKWS